MDFESKILILTKEMGFNRVEASMSLQDSNGNIDIAIEKLLAGTYKPPPYTTDRDEFAKKGNVKSPVTIPISNSYFLSDVTNRNRNLTFEDHPTAPPLENISNDKMKSTKQPPSYEDIAQPPPYKKIEKSRTIQEWEKDEGVLHFNIENNSQDFQNLQRIWGDGRCAVCFSLFHAKDLTKRTEENIVQREGKFFHYGCFSKKFGPKCSYCCFPLSQPDKDHDLSGQYLKYKNKDYHVECYEKYAGPRCTYCFDVIIEKPNGKYSGNRIIDGEQEFHLECYEKKMHAVWRAKNS